MLGIFVLQACTMANLDLHPAEKIYKGQLQMVYDWSDMEPEAIPDSMVVWAVRPVFRTKMSSNWASKIVEGEDRVYGRIIAPNDPFYYTRYRGTETRRDSLFLPPGEWVIASYTSSDSTKRQVENFTYDIEDEGNQLSYSMDTCSKLPSRYKYWYERNPYSVWADVRLSSAFYICRDTIVVDDVASPDSLYTAYIKPILLAQKVTISFDIEMLDKDVQVDSIVCAVSGVITSVNLNTTSLDISKTYQGIFHSDISETPEGYLRATGTVYVPGLLRSSNSSLLQGPGLLNVCVFVSYDDEVTGERKYRRLDGTTNMFHLLTETPSVSQDDMGVIMRTTPELDLHIKNRMQISKSKLSSAHDAITPWVDETIFEIELN